MYPINQIAATVIHVDLTIIVNPVIRYHYFILTITLKMRLRACPCTHNILTYMAHYHIFVFDMPHNGR